MSAPDLVTAPREVLEDALEYFTGSRVPTPPSAFGALIAGASPMGSLIRNINSALLPTFSSDPEGGARGVQTSIATKQESCPESAPRTETAIVGALRECRCDNPMVKCDHTGIRCTMCGELARIDAGASGVTKSDGGVEGHADSAPLNLTLSASLNRDGGVSATAGIKPGPSDQLSKTPSWLPQASQELYLRHDWCPKCHRGWDFTPPHEPKRQGVTSSGPSASVNGERFPAEASQGVTAGETAPNSPAVADTRRAGSAGLSPPEVFSDPAPSSVEER